VVAASVRQGRGQWDLPRQGPKIAEAAPALWLKVIHSRRADKRVNPCIEVR
jgi:hypothetical protein